MTDERPMDERALLDALREIAAAVDPVPAPVAAAARSLYTWRTVDAELAELVDDSLLSAAGVRADAPTRMLTFEAADVTLLVEVAEAGPTRRLVGQLLGGAVDAAADLEVTHADGASTAHADALGRFVVDGVPAGLVRLCFRWAQPVTRELATSWVRL